MVVVVICSVYNRMLQTDDLLQTEVYFQILQSLGSARSRYCRVGCDKGKCHMEGKRMVSMGGGGGRAGEVHCMLFL